MSERCTKHEDCGMDAGHEGDCCAVISLKWRDDTLSRLQAVVQLAREMPHDEWRGRILDAAGSVVEKGVLETTCGKCGGYVEIDPDGTRRHLCG